VVEPADIEVDGRTVKCHLYADQLPAEHGDRAVIASLPA
jgi:hypothetical protein